MNTTQKERGKQVLRIFLSYTAVDRMYANKLRSLLSQRPNLRIFTTETLSAGEDWESKLKDELSQCDIFIVLLSSNSVDSEWVLHELGAAWALNKPIIPIVTHPEVFSKIPLTLRGIKFAEIKDLEKPEVISQILEHYEEVATSHNSG
jgi:nucleoside 2-deoxyribosyltransferase